MNITDFISTEEVQRMCQELGIRDWTKLTETKVQLEEARIIQAAVGSEALQVPIEEFQHGLEVELEHGLPFPDANVTNNHPILTGKIVLAHLKEMLDYYTRLKVAELEGDLFKASKRGDAEKCQFTGYTTPVTYSKATPVNYTNTAPLYSQSAPLVEEVTRLSKMGNLPGKDNSPGRSDVRQENKYCGYTSNFNAVAGRSESATNRTRVKDKPADGEEVSGMGRRAWFTQGGVTAAGGITGVAGANDAGVTAAAECLDSGELSDVGGEVGQ